MIYKVWVIFSINREENCPRVVGLRTTEAGMREAVRELVTHDSVTTERIVSDGLIVSDTAVILPDELCVTHSGTIAWSSKKIARAELVDLDGPLLDD